MTNNERYENPVDQKTYVAEGGWKAYEPQGVDAPHSTERVKLVDVRLLTSENDFAARTTINALAAFIELIERSARDTLESVDSEAAVLVQFSCQPNQHTVQLAHQRSVTQDVLQSYYDALMALEPLAVSSGEVSFQATIHISK